MPVPIARSWRRPIRLITGVSSRIAPFGRTTHAQRILVPPGTSVKVSVPAMSACAMVVREASRAGRR
jgi:hypothetical protein